MLDNFCHDRGKIMKIPKAVAIERREKVWDLRKKGWTYELIAKEVGVTVGSVSKILTRLTKVYNDRFIEDVAKVKAEQVSSLEQVGYEAYQAWERSKEVAKLIRQKKAVSANGESLGISEQILESRDQDGDPRYLTLYLKSKEDIRKIIGADAPTKSEITGKDGGAIEFSNLNEQQLIDEASAILNAAREREAKENPSGVDTAEQEVETTARATDTSL